MPRPIRLSPTLTISELAEKLGMPRGRTSRQKLLRRLRAREAATDQRFLVKLGPGRNSPVGVSLASLREHCPTWFEKRDEAAEMMREQMAHLQEQIRELRARDLVLAAKIRELRRERSPERA
jgi:hypothetical protein